MMVMGIFTEMRAWMEYAELVILEFLVVAFGSTRDAAARMNTYAERSESDLVPCG